MSDSRKGPHERLAYLENKIEHLIRQGHIHEDAIRELKYKLSVEQVSDASNPKPIDWSKVAACVPVKVWDDRGGYSTTLYQTEDMVDFIELSDRVSLITGIDVAWHGGECPLPEGVMVGATRRDGNKYSNREASSFKWAYGGVNSCFDIISFRVTGIADGWTEEVGE